MSDSNNPLCPHCGRGVEDHASYGSRFYCVGQACERMEDLKWFEAADAATYPQPSERGKALAQRARDAARAEVRAHLAAGRVVYGRRDDEPVTIEPKRERER